MMNNRLFSILLGMGLCSITYAQVPAQTVPDFEFSRYNKSSFTNKDLEHGKILFFVFFDPDCDHCQRAFKSINAQYQSFEKTAIYLVSQFDQDKVNRFMATYAPQLKSQKNTVLLQDTHSQFITKFKPYRYPAMFLYSADKKLIDYEDNDETVFRLVNTIKKQSAHPN